MATIAKNSTHYLYAVSTSETSTSKRSLLKDFFTWCESMEDYRYLILVGIVLIQGNIFIPGALFAILKLETAFTGLSVYLLGASTLGVLVTNLAQVPMKVVISAFIINFVLIFTLVMLHIIPNV